MDFLDPKKRRRHSIILITGYVIIGFIVLALTVILLYFAYGYGLGKNGQIIQNGFLYLSSHPSGAQIAINDTPEGHTNTRLKLPAGVYNTQITRDGYRSWQRPITVEGGAVEHVDYPFLFPTKLVTTTVQSYLTVPGLQMQTPDKRWLLTETTTQPATFQERDLNNPKQAPLTLTLPSDVLSVAPGAQSLKLVAWANDNQHVLLRHAYGTTKTEYVLLDRVNPDKSLNLTKTLQLTPAQELSLQGKQYDHYFIYDTQAKVLSTASLGQPAPAPFLDMVLAYKAYDANTVMYITSRNAPAGQVEAVLRQGGQDYRLRSFAAKGRYLLDVSQYRGDWYAVAGMTGSGVTYIYKNPADHPTASNQLEVPLSVLSVPQASYLSFSPNSRFVMVEHGTTFAIYDSEYGKRYDYTLTRPLDKPQSTANWMDGNHLEYVSGGKLMVFDFDKYNLQTLMSASAAYLPVYDSNYQYVYALTAAPTPHLTLTSTALLIPADL